GLPKMRSFFRRLVMQSPPLGDRCALTYRRWLHGAFFRLQGYDAALSPFQNQLAQPLAAVLPGPKSVASRRQDPGATPPNCSSRLPLLVRFGGYRLLAQ